jgi:hypothetical protein
MKEYPSADGQAAQLTLTWPDALVTQIADAVAEHLRNGDLAPSRSPWLDVAGAAAYLEMTADAVRKAAQRGLLPGHQPFGKGSRYFFHRAELDERILGGESAGGVGAEGSAS